jgi:hypothetical protein
MFPLPSIPGLNADWIAQEAENPLGNATELAKQLRDLQAVLAQERKEKKAVIAQLGQQKEEALAQIREANDNILKQSENCHAKILKAKEDACGNSLRAKDEANRKELAAKVAECNSTIDAKTTEHRHHLDILEMKWQTKVAETESAMQIQKAGFDGRLESMQKLEVAVTGLQQRQFSSTDYGVEI